MKIGERIRKAWTAFQDPNKYADVTSGNYFYGGYAIRPDRPHFHFGNERSILASVINRIALDVAAVSIRHVKVDENGNFKEEVNSGLNNCLTLNANADQTAREFIQDIVMSLCDEGCIAVIVSQAGSDPAESGSYSIEKLRTAKILQWYPDRIQVRAFNEETGQKEDIYVLKEDTAIIENPLYAVMNEPNSTLRRLINKLNILDAIDKQSGSGKMDLIIQVPYQVRTERGRMYAETRRKDIEAQLTNSRYGIAYTDGTEHVIQLNRPVDNNLMSQVEYLTKELYSQLGISEAVFNGTAEEQEMLNYYNRTTEPFLAAIANAFRWKFLTKTARSQGQDILFFRNAFKLVPAEKLAEIADKFTRNEILSPNELRAIIGYKPSKDPAADELRNRNINQKNEGKIQNGSKDSPEGNNQDSGEATPNQSDMEKVIQKYLSELQNTGTNET